VDRFTSAKARIGNGSGFFSFWQLGDVDTVKPLGSVLAAIVFMQPRAAIAWCFVF
jgi:hypothetical protein